MAAHRGALELTRTRRTQKLPPTRTNKERSATARVAGLFLWCRVLIHSESLSTVDMALSPRAVVSTR